MVVTAFLIVPVFLLGGALACGAMTLLFRRFVHAPNVEMWTSTILCLATAVVVAWAGRDASLLYELVASTSEEHKRGAVEAVLLVCYVISTRDLYTLLQDNWGEH